jgi:plasmid stabilization system protein ParE
MGRFALTPAAKADLAEIAKYIRERGSRDAAKRVGDEIRRAMRRLADMPGMGHVRNDLAEESLRFWAVYSYLILYRPDTNPLQVIRVLHGARDVEAILESERGK